MNKSSVLSSPVLWLWLLAVATVVVLALLQGIETRLIAPQQQQADIALLEAILANVPHDNALPNDAFGLTPGAATFVQVDLLGLTIARTGYIARQQGNISGFVLPAATLEGYNGSIQLLVGVSVEGEITGVRILAHNETPRLGDKIELRFSDWVLNFNNRSLGNTDPLLWRVKQDGGEFDQFTGATITPRAVVGAVRKALEFFAVNKEALLNVNSSRLPPLEAGNHLITNAGITAWLVAIMQPLPWFLLGLLLALKNWLAPRQHPPPPSLPTGVEPGSKRVRVTGKS